MIITITGKPCSGKSTVSKILVEKFGFKRIGVGDIFKEEAHKRGMSAVEFNALCMSDPSFDFIIDKRTAELGKQLDGQKVIFDSRLAWHFVPNSFKVFVDLDEEESAKRLFESDREGKEKYSSISSAKTTLKNRADLERERYKKLYDVVLDDLSNYDFVINSKNKTPEEISDAVWQAYSEFIEQGK